MIRVSTFSGMVPRTGPALLDISQAQLASNADLRSGELRPIYKPSLQHVLSAIANSIYRARNGDWLGFSKKTEVVEAPLVDDQYSRLYYSNEDGVFITAPSVWSGGTGNLPQVSYSLGQPAPAGAPTLNKSGTPAGSPVLIYYAYTRISIWGEESPPSPLGSITVETGETVTISNMAPIGAGYVPTDKYRIYRSSTGSTATDLLFVADTVSTSFVDNVTVLGESIPSILWDPPPAGLRRLIALSNGSIAGVVGREVWFTPPYIPHAWPEDYRITLDHTAVSIGAYDSTVVVATDSRPYVLHGSHPDSYLPQKSKDIAPCLSADGLAVTAAGVLWPTADGLYGVGPGGSGLVTEKIITEKEWDTYYPATMIGANFHGGYVGIYTGINGNLGGVQFGGNGAMCEIGMDAIDAITLPDGHLYMLSSDGVSIIKYDGSSSPNIVVWRSRLNRFPLVSMMAAKVDFHSDITVIPETVFVGGYDDDAPIACHAVGCVAVACDSNMPPNVFDVPGLILTVIADGEQVTKEYVTDTEPLILPSIGLARDWEFIVETNTAVREVSLAPSVEGVL